MLEGYRNILKLSCRPLALTSYKAFFKKKRGLELVSLPDFLHDLWRKTLFLLYSINWPNFIVWLLLLREVLGNMGIVTDNYAGYYILNFEIKIIFLIKPFFLHKQKSRDKTLNILRSWERKELLRWNKK